MVYLGVLLDINNGIKLQWLHYSGTSSSISSNFPTSFSTVYSIVACANKAAGSMSAQRVLSYTTSSVSVYVGPYFVIAIGG